jgi:membrane fusion protein, multidrug efflux system
MAMVNQTLETQDEAQHENLEDENLENEIQAERRKAGIFRRRRWLVWLLRLGLVLVLAAAGYFWWQSRNFEETDDAQVDGHIDPISARIGGQVVRVNVEEGQFVKAGDVLVEIDQRDYQVAIEHARADYLDAVSSSQAAQLDVPISQVGSSSQIHSAEADILNAEAGVTAANHRVDEAEARLVQAQAGAKTANLDRARYESLAAKKEVSQQQFDQADAAATSANSAVTASTAAVRSAQELVKQAQARLAQSQAALANARITPKQVSVTQAHARSGEALAARSKASLDQAELNLGYTRILAPADGIVGSRSVQLGQNVQVGQQMLAIVPLNEIWVTADFKETQLEHMRPGQPVEIVVDALGSQTFHGTVTSIGGATGARFSLLPPENATGNYVKVVQRVPVRIDFDGRQSSGFNQDGRLRPGLSVVPSVRVQ